MPDYIDREAFLASKVFLVAGTLDDYDQGYMDGVDAVEEAAKEFPAADVRPVVHGKWEGNEEEIYYHGLSFYKCSVCGYHDALLRDEPPNEKFCGNCGAQMDGGEVDAL